MAILHPSWAKFKNLRTLLFITYPQGILYFEKQKTGQDQNNITTSDFFWKTSRFPRFSWPGCSKHFLHRQFSLTRCPRLFLSRCWTWPRTFPCKYLKLLSNPPKPPVPSYLRHCQPSSRILSQPQLPPWLLQPKLTPWLAQSWRPAVTVSCCRAVSGTLAMARHHSQGAGHFQEPGPG